MTTHNSHQSEIDQQENLIDTLTESYEQTHSNRHRKLAHRYTDETIDKLETYKHHELTHEDIKHAKAQFDTLDQQEFMEIPELKIEDRAINGSDVEDGDIYKNCNKLKLEDKIYFILPNSTIGQGTFGQVMLALGEDEKLYVIKKEKINSMNEEDFSDTIYDEIEITKDLGIGVSSMRVKNGATLDIEKDDLGEYYSVQKFKGETLSSLLEQNDAQLSDNDRLEIAIKTCKALDDLHLGRNSKSGQNYAHRDLKHQNILIDDDGNITLVDYGLTTKQLDESPKDNNGSPEYLPHHNFYESTNRKIDTFGMKRLLSIHDHYLNHSGWKLKGIESSSLLRKEFIDQHPSLCKILSTETNEVDDTKLAQIYKELMLARDDLTETQTNLLSQLEERDMLTTHYIDFVINGELDQDDFDQCRTVLSETDSLDLNSETIKCLALKDFPRSSFEIVHQMVDSEISEIEGIKDHDAKEGYLKQIKKSFFEDITQGKSLNDSVERVSSYIGMDQHKHILHSLWSCLKVLFALFTEPTKLSNGCASFFNTNRQNAFQSAARTIESDDNIRQAIAPCA
ncbi:protein kinase [Gammaproteobacteria bacterium]|nr:protein kinase [Gammaproteobacteria bacterium]